MSRYCTLVLENNLYGIPIASVQEVLRVQRISRVPHAPHAVAGILNVRGEILTAINLRQRLGFPEIATTVPMHVLVRDKAEVVGLVVDKVGEVMDVPDASLEAPPPTMPASQRVFLKGACPMPDQLLLVLDVEKILDLS